MVVRKLTEKQIQTAQFLPPGRRGRGRSYYITEDGSGRSSVPGFGIRVHSRRKVFVLRYNGRPHVLGEAAPIAELSLQDARELALSKRLRLMRGDPIPTARTSHTIQELKERFFQAHVLPNSKPRTIEAYEHHWTSKILPRFGQLEIQALTAEQVDTWKLKSKGTPVAFNRALQQLQAALNYALKIEWISHNVAAKIDFYPERPRRRRITPDEYARLGDALHKAEAGDLITQPALAAIWTILLTGCRPFEVLRARLEWSVLDGENPRIDWPLGTAKGDRRGHERGRLVLLPPEVAERLHSLSRPEGCEWLIPATQPGQHMVDLKKGWSRLLKLADLKDSGITLRDARTSFRSEAPVVGVAREHVASLMGHAPGSPITDTAYLQIMSPELARASRAMSEHLARRLGVRSADEEDA